MGKVTGHRGRGGELTVRVFAGDGEHWTGTLRWWIGRAKENEGCLYEAQHARAYRDRLVLKLRGVDDADRAARLRGCEARVASAEAPELPQGVHYADRLVGMTVRDESGRILGRVVGVLPTGGTDLLRVAATPAAGSSGTDEELLIPMAREFVEVVEDRATIQVRLPEGLEGLNRSDA